MNSLKVRQAAQTDCEVQTECLSEFSGGNKHNIVDVISRHTQYKRSESCMFTQTCLLSGESIGMQTESNSTTSISSATQIAVVGSVMSAEEFHKESARADLLANKLRDESARAENLSEQLHTERARAEMLAEAIASFREDAKSAQVQLTQLREQHQILDARANNGKTYQSLAALGARIAKASNSAHGAHYSNGLASELEGMQAQTKRAITLRLSGGDLEGQLAQCAQNCRLVGSSVDVMRQDLQFVGEEMPKIAMNWFPLDRVLCSEHQAQVRRNGGDLVESVEREHTKCKNVQVKSCRATKALNACINGLKIMFTRPQLEDQKQEVIRRASQCLEKLQAQSKEVENCVQEVAAISSESKIQAETWYTEVVAEVRNLKFASTVSEGARDETTARATTEHNVAPSTSTPWRLFTPTPIGHADICNCAKTVGVSIRKYKQRGSWTLVEIAGREQAELLRDALLPRGETIQIEEITQTRSVKQQRASESLGEEDEAAASSSRKYAGTLNAVGKGLETSQNRIRMLLTPVLNNNGGQMRARGYHRKCTTMSITITITQQQVMNVMLSGITKPGSHRIPTQIGARAIGNSRIATTRMPSGQGANKNNRGSCAAALGNAWHQKMKL